MKKLTKIILSVALFAAIAATAAQIERWNVNTTTYSGGTNIIAAVSTNGYFTIDVPRAPSVMAMSFTMKFAAAAGAGDRTTVDLELFRGIDSGRFETNAYLTHVISGLSTTSLTTFWETNVAAVPYLRARFKNYSTNATPTNVLVMYGWKN